MLTEGLYEREFLEYFIEFFTISFPFQNDKGLD